MKHLLRFSSLYLLCSILLASCSSATHVTVTAEATSSSTSTPLPLTATPTATTTPEPTPTPGALESGQGKALLGLGYEQKQLKEYTSFAEGTYQFKNAQGQVDTVTYHGIIGTKADGSKEILAIKFSDNPNYLKLSSTEIMELANKACSSRACFSQFTWGDEREPITFINGVTTGIILSDDKKDETGNIIASAQSALMLTLDDSGHPRFVKMVVQVKDPAKPDVDLLKNGLLNILGFVTESTTKVHSQRELAGFFQKGIQIEFGVQQIQFLKGGKVMGWSFFKDTFGSDSLYSSALKSFLLKNGLIEAGNDSIIVLPSTIHN